MSAEEPGAATIRVHRWPVRAWPPGMRWCDRAAAVAVRRGPGPVETRECLFTVERDTVRVWFHGALAGAVEFSLKTGAAKKVQFRDWVIDAADLAALQNRKRRAPC